MCLCCDALLINSYAVVIFCYWHAEVGRVSAKHGASVENMQTS